MINPRLAKLRYYNGKDQKDLEKFMSGEFRQNMQAIESYLRQLTFGFNELTCQLSSLTIVNDVVAFFTFAFYVRSTNNNNQGNAYLCKQDGLYAINVNLADVTIDGAKDVDFRIYKNGTLLIATAILRTDSTNNFRLPFSYILELELKVSDLLTFGVFSTGASLTDVTVGYGYLNIKQVQGV